MDNFDFYHGFEVGDMVMSDEIIGEIVEITFNVRLSLTKNKEGLIYQRATAKNPIYYVRSLPTKKIYSFEEAELEKAP